MARIFFHSAPRADDIFDFSEDMPISAGIAAFQTDICELASKHHLKNPRAKGYYVVMEQIGGVTCLDDLVAARKAFTSMLPYPHQLYVADDYPFEAAQLVALPLGK